MKLLCAAAFAVSLLFGGAALADPPTPIASGSFTATGVPPNSTLSIANDSSCSIVFAGSGNTFSATVQTSSDNGATWVTATPFGTSGVIAANSTSVASIATSGLLRFRFNVTAASGTTSFFSACTGAVGSGSSGGVAQNVNVVSPVNGSGFVEIVCVQGCETATTGSTQTILTSASATTCTAIKTAATVLRLIINSGPTMSVFPQFYNDNGTCAAGDLIYGDGSTLVLGAGQILTFGTPQSAGLSYKLSGALTSNLVVTTTP